MIDTDTIAIDNVADTALWVAHYRAIETQRADALFRDPLAERLAGERGRRIAENMKTIGRYTAWSVVSRTVMIDEFLLSLIGPGPGSDLGIDTVINLGAGLDTRPYRMALPSALQWIEVDSPQIIALKQSELSSERPRCALRRVAVDLADGDERRAFLKEVGAGARRAVVLTEGVIPYLSEDKVSQLAAELHAEPAFRFWITEFFDPQVYPYLKTSVRTRKMKNAPFIFFPPDWMGYFESRGWRRERIQYSSEVARRCGRRVPMPWWAMPFWFFASRATKEKSGRMAGYMVLKKADSGDRDFLGI